MKKLALILALLIIPCTAFGLEMLNDNTLDSVTGQSGVDIAMDDIQIFMNIEKMAWIDCDGYGSMGRWACTGAGGAVALSNFQLDILNVNAIVGTVDASGGLVAGTHQSGSSLGLVSVACGKIPLFYNYATSTTEDCYLNILGTESQGLDHLSWGKGQFGLFENDSRNFTPNFLSIDVTDELPAATAGLNSWFSNSYTSSAISLHNGTAASTLGGVLIGLPTVEIYINSMTMKPVYDGDISGNSSFAMNDDSHLRLSGYSDYGVIQMEGITFSVLSGWIEIAPH